MWQIGDYKFEGKVVLAPMAGVTSFSYRKFMEKFGPVLTYSEMISDMGLIYENKETEEYLNFPETDVPCVVQLFGSNPENLVKAAKRVQKLSPFTKIIDINMACPVPKVTKNGAGSALLKNPKLMGEIVRKIKEETGLFVTAKIRLGFDKNSINFLETISELEKAGVSAIALHCRTAKDLYLGQPNFEIAKDLRKKMSVPLIISGNIYTAQDATKAMEITGADAVMVARGGMGNPRLISEINAYFNNKEIPQPTFEEQIDYCLELGKYLCEEKGEATAMRIYRSIAPKFFIGYPNSKNYRIELATKLINFSSLENILNSCKI